MTSQHEKFNLITQWSPTLLLAAIAVISGNNYGETQKLNLNLAENNRIAEERGRITAEILSIKDLVSDLRIKIERKEDKESVKQIVTFVKSSLDGIRAKLSEKVDKKILIAALSSQDQLIADISKKFNSSVTQQQLKELSSRINAISARIDKALNTGPP